MTRRNLITATDAAAFAAAQEFVLGGDGCLTIDDDYVEFNNPTAFNVACQPAGTATAGAVTVYAEDNVETWLASIIGLGDFTANSASTVRRGGTVAVSGLRPFALCADAPGIEDWIADPSIEVTVRVNFSNSGQPDICNNCTNVPGNWGLLDFDGVGGNDTKEWVENGYPGEIIRDLKLTGPDSGRFITITFLPGLVTGPCCSETGGPSNVVVIGQCAVDNRNLAACDP